MLHVDKRLVLERNDRNLVIYANGIVLQESIRFHRLSHDEDEATFIISNKDITLRNLQVVEGNISKCSIIHSCNFNNFRCLEEQQSGRTETPAAGRIL